MQNYNVKLKIFITTGIIVIAVFSAYRLEIIPYHWQIENQLADIIAGQNDSQKPVRNNNSEGIYASKYFSFRYPDGFKVFSNSVAEGQDIITFENDKAEGFQIFIMPFDEAGPITKERIWQDMPDMKINDPKEADLDGAEALVFYGNNEDVGETFEVWVVRKDKLYQIMASKESEKIVVEVLEMWEWEKR